jgi:hypothetical protein
MIEKEESKSQDYLWGDFKAISEAVKETPIIEEETGNVDVDVPLEIIPETVIPAVESPQNVVPDIVSFLDDAVSLLDAEGLMFSEDIKTYTPDAQGFKELIKDNMESYKSRLDREYEQRLADARNNIERGGELKISEMDVNNADHAENMLTQYYTKTGWEQEEIEDKIAALKELDTIPGEAKIAQRFLVKEEKAQEAEARIAAEKAVEEEQKYIAEYISEIKTEIDRAENIAGFALSNKDKAGFKDFLFKKDKNGETQAAKVANDPKHRLRVAFFEYMDYSKADMEIKVRTELANEQAKKASRFTSMQMGAKGSTIVEPEQTDNGIKGFFSKNTIWNNHNTED